MGVIFLPSVCVTASAFRHSRLAKGAEVSFTRCMYNPTVVFCRSARDACFTIFSRNSTVYVSVALHANIVEEYVFLSALLYDQSCLQSSPSFQHQFVWHPFSRTLLCKGGSFHVHVSTKVVSPSLCYVAVSRARENNWDKVLLDDIIIDCLCHCH